MIINKFRDRQNSLHFTMGVVKIMALAWTLLCVSVVVSATIASEMAGELARLT